MKVEFKGIVRGTYSQYQKFAEDSDNVPVMKFEGKTLEEVVAGLALPEWIYVLTVNGRRIKSPETYLKRKGIWGSCIREGVYA